MSLLLLVTEMTLANPLHFVPFFVERNIFEGYLDQGNDSLLSLDPFALLSLGTFRLQHGGLLILYL